MPLEIDDQSLRVIGNNERKLRFYDDSRTHKADIYLDENDILNVGNLQIDVSGNGSGGSLDLSGVGFLTVGSTPLLSQERILAAGDGLVASDEGGGNNFTLDLRTPGTLSASTSNSASGNHTHTVSASSNPGASAALLQSTSSGGLTLNQLNVDNLRLDGNTLSAQTGDITLDPAGDDVLLGSADRIGTDNFVSQLTGWRIDYDGSADFREIFADELHVKAFIADIEQALAGGQIVSKSVAIISRDFHVPFQGDIISVSTASDFFTVSGDQTGVIEASQTFVVAGSTGNDGTWTTDHTEETGGNTRIYVTGNITDATADGEIRMRKSLFVEDLPGFENTAVFANSDWLRLRTIDRSGGGLVVADVWGTVQTYADLAGGEQSWVFICRDDGGVAGDYVNAGAIAIDYGASGDGYWEVTALDSDGPYSQIVTWVTDPSVSGNHTLKTRVGNLDGVTDADLSPSGFGLYSDNAFLKGDVIAAGGVVKLDDNGVWVEADETDVWAVENGYKMGPTGQTDAARIWTYYDTGDPSMKCYWEVEEPGGGNTARISMYVTDSGTNQTAITVPGTGGDILMSSDSVSITTADFSIETDGLFFQNSTERLGLGTNSPSHQLDLFNNTANYIARIFNDGNASTRHGLIVRGGEDSNPSHIAIRFQDGNGDNIGSIAGDGAGGTNYNQSSDERLKQDIETMTGALDRVLSLRPVAYRGLGADRRRRKTPGFIAQEVMAVIPEAANYDEESDLYSLAWNKIIPYLIGAVQELNGRIAQLEAA